MKQVKPILLSTLLALLTLGSVIYTSCTTNNNKCSNVVCLNGGTCNAGNCSCPSGFTGSDCGAPVTSAITFTNDTYTPINIIANGTSSIIAVGGSVTYNGLYGNPLNAVASTWGTGTTTTMVVGDVIRWNLSVVFPQTGAVNYGIDVDSTYFFLKVQNNSATEPATGVYVNYGTKNQTFDTTLVIPNNGTIYGIGYYRAYDSSEIYINSTDGTTYWSTYAFVPPVTFTKNQSFTFKLY